jgi:Protein of unknown function (DUF938)
VLIASGASLLGVYGPFLQAGAYRCAQNKHFDQSLRARSCGYRIREQSEVVSLARSGGGLRIRSEVDCGDELLLVFAVDE